MLTTDPFAVLRIRPEATLEDIRAAYLRRSKETHPDLGGNETLFREVNDAYETLSDPVKRFDYYQAAAAAAPASPWEDRHRPSPATGASPADEPERQFRGFSPKLEAMLLAVRVVTGLVVFAFLAYRHIPVEWVAPLKAVFPLVFLVLTVLLCTSIPLALVAVLGGGLSVLGAAYLPPGWNIVSAGFLASLIGLPLERLFRRPART